MKTLACLAALLAPVCVYGVDGVVLINQATVNASGGFPYVITQPGSYKLSGNLVPGSGKTGIEIAADHVTIDFSGFSILGPGLNGIDTKAGARPDGSFLYNDITIRNGTISGMSGAGIQMIADPALIEYMKIESNGNGGVQVNGVGLIVIGNVVAPGIAQVIDHCVIANNARFGLFIDGGRVSYNVVTRNGIGNDNANGMNFENGGQIIYNIVSENGGRGMRFDTDYGNSPIGMLLGNVIRGNGSLPVSGSFISLGQNLCNNAACAPSQF